MSVADLSRCTKPVEKIEKVSKIVSLKNIPSHVSLDDENLTKSYGMAFLKQRLTRYLNKDFENLTKNVLDQGDSDLCVPISVSVLVRWAIKNDVKLDESYLDYILETYFSIDIIFPTLTMIIYPRSLAGFTLNPKQEEQGFQENEIELLLKRLKYPTYFFESGWDMIRNYGTTRIDAEFDYEEGSFLSKVFYLFLIKYFFTKNFPFPVH